MADKSKILLQVPKGMHDILNDDYAFYQNVFDKAEEVASYYGFSPIQTPHLEKMELFSASLGTTSDIIEKQMYILKTRGGDKLALRPEGTAPLTRAYIEHGMHTLPQPVMLWYKGSFFRHESPQKGRFREFQQFGLEIIGEQKAINEAMIIKIMILILQELGLGPLIVHINSMGDKEDRVVYRKELISFYRKKINFLCKDCKRRLKENPLRLLDCKESRCIEIKQEAPQIINFLSSTSKQHFKEVLEFLDSNEISYLLDNYLVRGLDYYSKTVFEIFLDKSALTEEEQKTAITDTLAAGGRYDYLAKMIGKKEMPAAGGAIGVDRVVQVMKDKNILPKQKRQPKVFFIQIGPMAKYKSLNIVEAFRKAKIQVAHSVSKENLKGQLKIASRLNIPYVLMFGQKEALEGSIIVKDMRTENQETVPLKEVVQFIKDKLK